MACGNLFRSSLVYTFDATLNPDSIYLMIVLLDRVQFVRSGFCCCELAGAVAKI